MVSVEYNCFTRLYRRKIIYEFGLDFLMKLDISTRLYPLVYACLKHRLIPRGKRKIHYANGINKLLCNNKDWERLKEKIEKGEDINNYVSKLSKQWDCTDFLLFSCNIYHIHLRKNSEGGIGDDLIFAIIKDDSLYVVRYGNHHDIFSPGELVQICESSWPGLHFNVQIEQEQRGNYTENEFFRQNAMNKKWQFTLFKPIKYIDKITGEYKFVSNHQNTAMIDFNDGDKKWKLPFKCVLAFNYEENLIHNIIRKYYSIYGIAPDSMDLDANTSEYVLKFPSLVGHGNYIEERISPKKIITISFPSNGADVNWQKII